MDISSAKFRDQLDNELVDLQRQYCMDTPNLSEKASVYWWAQHSTMLLIRAELAPQEIDLVEMVSWLGTKIQAVEKLLFRAKDKPPELECARLAAALYVFRRAFGWFEEDLQTRREEEE